MTPGAIRQREYREQLYREHPEKYARVLEQAREKKKQYREDDPEAYKAKQAAYNKKHRYYAYGLSDTAIARLYASQDGKCAICQKALDLHQTRKWCVDHDHDTGTVRGILCYGCNVALGQFQDSPAMLMRAIEYLEVEVCHQ